MPLVFVHGVAVRRGQSTDEKNAFDSAVRARDQLFRSVAMRGLVRPPAVQHIENPYWGDEGATFSYDLVSIPASDTEAFGASDDPVAQVLMETVPADVAVRANQQPNGDQLILVTLARERSLEHAIDAVVAAAGIREVDTSVATADEQAHELAEFAAKALAYAVSNPDLSWLTALHPVTNEPRIQSDEDFLEALTQRVEEFAAAGRTSETFGGIAVLNRLKATARSIAKVAKRTLGAIVGAAGGAALGAALGGTPGVTIEALRPIATRRGGMFFGDVFAYLAKRKKIAGIVMDALDAGDAKRTAMDDKLIVVAHSMGGNIVYDILSSFRPKMNVNLLVTVGSQVGLFKELCLYAEDEGKTPIAPKKVAKPDSIQRWINVFDPMDALAFAAEGVFEDVKDFAIANNGTAFDAHVLYFVRPVFHERLRARMAEVGLGSAQ
jgi:hypothetical protein